MYYATVRFIKLNGCESLGFHVEDVRRLVFDCQCFRGIAKTE